MPGKLSYMLAAGAALLGISQPSSDLALTIQRYDCGINVMPGDVESFVQAVMRFRDDRAYLEHCRRNARQAAVEVFSRNVNAARVLRLIRPLVDQTSRTHH